MTSISFAFIITSLFTLISSLWKCAFNERLDMPATNLNDLLPFSTFDACTFRILDTLTSLFEVDGISFLIPTIFSSLVVSSN